MIINLFKQRVKQKERQQMGISKYMFRKRKRRKKTKGAHACHARLWKKKKKEKDKQGREQSKAPLAGSQQNMELARHQQARDRTYLVCDRVCAFAFC